ncbi:hypothetical protein MVEN_00044700 [Mycena venus]|uniref:Uncharacterized protein n=1 Tax=Mycena venus TaxID=2733690 RepID=A0A8H7DEY2_9AGAR|nr:hypothetical protein MVEN_00044700 [Mycena venus]
MSSPQDTPLPSLPPHPLHDSGPTTLRVWTKMSAREYKALGLGDDPVRHWVLAELYPLYVAAVQADSIGGSRENYVKTTLFDVFEDAWQFARKNYNIALYNATLTKMYNGSDASVKAEMEEHARRANEVIEAGPTPDDIAKNQETIDTAIVKKLKSLMGHGWTGHGDMVFFVRAGFVNRDNKIATLCLAVGPKYTVEPYASSREDEETKEFAEYAVKILSPAPPSEPTLVVDGAGNAMLPKIKTKNTPSETLRQLLKGYAAITHPEHTATSVVLVSADGSQVDLDNASREDLILFYNQVRKLRKAGTEVSVTVGTSKAPADGPDPQGEASCQPIASGGSGTAVNAVPTSGMTVLSTVSHANTPAHPEGSPTALVNPGPLPASISGDTATVLPDTTLPGACVAVTDIEPVVAPAVNAAAVGATVNDIQPQFASSESSLSPPAEHPEANNLYVGKRKRATHDDMSAGKSVKRQALMIKDKNLPTEPRRSTRSKDKASVPASKPLNKSGNIRGWKGFAAVDDDGNEVSPEEYEARRNVTV